MKDSPYILKLIFYFFISSLSFEQLVGGWNNSVLASQLRRNASHIVIEPAQGKLTSQ